MTEKLIPGTDKKAASPEEKGYIDVFHGNYYIRVKPNRKAKALGVAKNGDKVPYLGKIQNGWYKVKFNGKIGWLYSGAGKVVEEIVEFITVTNGKWVVHDSPSSSGKKLGNVAKGDKLILMGLETDTWQQIEFEGKEGWVTKKAFKINK